MEEKDLGVLFTEDLKFSKHIGAAVNKSNRVVGAIRRSFRYLDKAMLVQLYRSLVRGHLEYANTVWCPSKKANIDHLERVQHRATKLVPELKELPYPERLKQLKLPSLVYRRDMIETYKILNSLADTIGASPLQLAEESKTHSHNLKLKKNHCRTTLRQHIFSQ